MAIRRGGPTVMSFREARGMLYTAAVWGFANDRCEWVPPGLKAKVLPTRATAVGAYARWQDDLLTLLERDPPPLWACRIVAAFDDGPAAARAEQLIERGARPESARVLDPLRS